MALPAALMLALASGAAAQSPEVKEVKVDAPPELARRMMRYVKVKQGEPLSPVEVRDSVELLFATGDFEDVWVETEPVDGGVSVAFRLLAAPRMSALRVRGDRVLSEKDVRQAARLRVNEPLWDARLEDAARDVALLLSERGYLEARVQGSAERTDAGAVANFDVQAGPRAHVSEVLVDAAPPPLEASLRAKAAPARGEVWQKAKAQRAADAMGRELRQDGRWRAEVTVQEEYNPKDATVKVRYQVSAGPETSLSFRGFSPPNKLRKAAERALRLGRAQSDALEQVADLIEEHLQAQGHRNPRVTRSEQQTNDSVHIVYEVDAGDAATVAGVSFSGFEGRVPESSLRTQPAAPLREGDLENDLQTLTDALRQQGYAEARVDSETSAGGGPVPVLFRARPGPRSVVGRVTVEAAPAGFTVPPLQTRVQQPYRLRDLALDKSALLGGLRDAGYLQARLEAQVEMNEDKTAAQVTFRIEPGPWTRFGDVVVAGLQHTREEVVRRELMFEPGDPFSPTKLVEAQRRLQGLGIFERLAAREIASESAEQRPLVVALDEAPRTAIAYGVGYAEHDLLRGNVEVTLKNLAGMDRTLSTYARISFLGSRLLATYREPRLFGYRRDLYVTVFREEQERDAFSYIRYGGLLQTARALNSRLTLIERFTYQQTETFNIKVPIEEIDRQFLPSTFSGPSASLVFDTRNDPLLPKRGLFVGADAELSHSAFGGDSFAKGLLQAASFTSLTPRVVLALAGRIGLSRTYQNEPPRLPLPERFFAGGDYSLRGYDLDAVDPEGGNGLLLGSVELRLAVTPRWEIAAFTDMGNTYPLASEMSLSKLLYTIGAGIRYRSPIGPLRVDYGYKLNPRPGEKSYHVHVTVGYAF